MKSLYFGELFLGNTGGRDVYRLAYINVVKKNHNSKPSSNVDLSRANENKYEKLFFGRGKFDYTQSVVHA